METFFSFLEKRVDDCSSLLCVGLDPHPAELPAPTADAARTFCLRLVKATAPYAAAFKPNAAFFELYGAEGWATLKDVIAAVQEESDRMGSMIPVILDAKRGDIASTAEAYAKSAFEQLGVHAITLSPYLGKDSIDPFLAYKEKGVFLLCKTSNPGAADLQDLIVGADLRVRLGTHTGVPLHVHIAQLAQTWNTGNNIGLVVGATQPEALARVRAAALDLWFLVPGVGAQGGDLETALRSGLRADGKGMLVNVSRAISRAENPAKAAAELRDEMVNIQYQISREKRPESRKITLHSSLLSALADEHFLFSQSAEVKEIMKNVIILRAERMWGSTGKDVIEYMAISHLFRTIKIGESIPWYQIIVYTNQEGNPVNIEAIEEPGR